MRHNSQALHKAFWAKHAIQTHMKPALRQTSYGSVATFLPSFSGSSCSLSTFIWRCIRRPHPLVSFTNYTRASSVRKRILPTPAGSLHSTHSAVCNCVSQPTFGTSPWSQKPTDTWAALIRLKCEARGIWITVLTSQGFTTLVMMSSDSWILRFRTLSRVKAKVIANV